MPPETSWSSGHVGPAVLLLGCLTVGLLFPPAAVGAPVDDAYRTAVIAMREGRTADAAAGFERVLTEDPRSTRALLNLGICRARLSDWPAAIAAYERLLSIDPSSARANNNLANVYFRQGRYEEASTRYLRALELNPEYLRALYHYGWVERQLNRPETATDAFDRCLRIQPKDDRDRATQLDCLFYLATLRFRDGDAERAAPLLEQLLQIRPAHPEARYYLGMTYRKLGRRDEAREQLEIHRKLLSAARGDEPIRKEDAP